MELKDIIKKWDAETARLTLAINNTKCHESVKEPSRFILKKLYELVNELRKIDKN